MNIFYLDSDPRIAASYHCDKHVVKMILESAQLLSTAHRVLDGVETRELSPGGRNLKVWYINDFRNIELYKATHVNHPCAIWTRQSVNNYDWLQKLFIELCYEYTRRYAKTHLCEAKFGDVLVFPPDNINDLPFEEPPQCMPDHCKVPGDTVQAYRNYYIQEKSDIAVWNHSTKPNWYK